jgi:YVTN family beta-propeller protein
MQNNLSSSPILGNGYWEVVMNRKDQVSFLKKLNRQIIIVSGLALTLFCLSALLMMPYMPCSAFSRVSAAISYFQSEKTSADGIWQIVDENSIVTFRVDRSKLPQSYQVVRLNQAALTRIIRQAPMEFSAAAKANEVVLTLPMPDGRFARFRIEESPVMQSALMASYPEVKTYQGQGIDDPTSTTRFRWSPEGLNGIIITNSRTSYIDLYHKERRDYYVAYYSQNHYKDGEFRCLSQITNNSAILNSNPGSTSISSGQTLRNYDIAIAATKKYVGIYSDNKSIALMAITDLVNQLNAVYRREIAVSFTLVNNETDILFDSSSGTDPFASVENNACGMADMSQSVIDGRIGSGNYDIGHVLGAGGNDEVGSGCVIPGDGFNGTVCRLANKAKGASTRRTPSGEAFFDIVVHEVGHQLGATHTFNGTSGGCGQNNQRVAASAYEPGSGSTIMSYGLGGICDPQGIATNKDNYFHNKSLEQIINYTSTSVGSTCASAISTGNNPPTVAVMTPPLSNYVIPIQTPFKLTASGQDPNGDAITYCWEEYDLGLPSPPDNDVAGARPIFRSFPPTSGGERIFPQLSYILNGATYGESLPRITRTMNFRITVRDNRSTGGGACDATLPVEVTASSGPFLVTLPNQASSWVGGTQQVVKWDVAGTSASPINCANVRILFYEQNGSQLLNERVLVNSTSNDGEAAVIAPNLSTQNARIKVEAIGNIFFKISQRFSTTTGAGGGDTINPTVTITAPTSNSTYITSGNTLSLAGRALDNIGVTQVTWSNSRGGSGTASGTTNWTASITSLQSGTNILTVTARDAAGNLGSDILTVTYNPPPTCGNGTSVSYRVNGGPPVHPNGTLIKSGTDSTVYVIYNGQKRGIPSETILNNLYQQPNGGFAFKDVITIAADEFANYPTGAVVNSSLPSNGRTQPDGRLIQKPGNSEISIVTNNGQRRPFTSESAFLGLGYLYCNVVSASDYDSYPAGPPADANTFLNIASIIPTGVQTRDWGGSVTYTFTVTDALGTPISGASVAGGDNLRGLVFLATSSTDSNGQGTYTTTVPNDTPNGTYDIVFVASKTGYTDSLTFTRQVQVSHVPQTLMIVSVEPSALQTRDWGGSVTYTVTVRDSGGNPVSGATVVGEDDLRGTIFTTSPSTTNSNGQINYTTTVPNGAPNLIYDIVFIAQKAGYLESSSVSRQVLVNHVNQTTDTTGPGLIIASHTNGQTVMTAPITLTGTASDAGRGDSGISSVTVNGVRANGDTTTGAGTASWNLPLTLNQGTNTITVIAKDGSSNQNSTTQSIAINYQPGASSGSIDFTWQYRANMPQERWSPAVAVYNGKIHVIGGDYLVSHYSYDPATNSWASLAAPPGNGISEGAATVVGNKIYAIHNPFDEQMKIYDPATNTWTTGATMPVSPRRGLSVVTVAGKIYAIGGADNSLNPFNTVQMYDPITDTWNSKASMPTARSFASAAVVNNLVYVIGGLGDSSVLNKVEVYDPVANSWVSRNPMLNPTYIAGCDVLNGKIYVIGGGDGINPLNLVREYDPATDTWRNLSPIQTARYQNVAATVNNKMYVIGGNSAAGTLSSTEEGTPVQIPDTTGPSLIITSHTDGQMVTTATVTLAGTATDAGRGNNGISSVTVNGVRANGDTATGSGTANWNLPLTLNQGTNIITVVARDNNSDQNSTTQTITILFNTGSSGCSTYTISLTITNLTQPIWLGVSGGKLFASSQGRVHVIDLASNTVIVSLPFSSYPFSYGGRIAFWGGKAYIPLWNLGSQGQVAIVDIATNTVTGYIPVSAEPYGVAAYNGRVYVTHNVQWANGNPSTVDVIDPGTNSVIATINAGINTQDIVIVPSLNRGYAVNYTSANVTVIDLGSNTTSGPIALPINPRSAVLAAGKIYVAGTLPASQDGRLVVIDPTTNSITTQINVGRDPTGLAAIDNRVFVTNQSDLNIMAISTDTNTVVKTLAVGSSPTGVAVDPSTGKIYVANQGGPTISVVVCAPCTFSISPTSQSFSSSGGTGSVTVTAGAGCNWMAGSNDSSWISITAGSSGSGGGTVTFSVAANQGTARSGTMTIAGLTFTVTQSAPAITMRIDSVTPAAGRASGGQQIKLAGTFSNLLSVTVGGVPASWSYSNGTSEVTLTTPPHAAGAVNIDLMPTLGSPYSKSNAFAYLPTLFTDDTLVVGVTTAKAQHILELRQAVDALRALAGFAPAPWTDPTLTPTSTMIRAVHIAELRTYLDQAAGAGSYDPTLSSGMPIKRVHIEELRQRIRSIAGP